MTLDEYLDAYDEAHRHPMNQLTHAIGIPLIVASVFVMLAAVPWGLTLLWWGLGMFVVGWIFQFIGHAYEGNGPKFLQGPAFLLVGVLWVGLKFLAVLGLYKRPKRALPSGDGEG